MSERLAIGLEAWIIQDGNYGDFARGDRRAFALEFFPMGDLREPLSGSPQACSLTRLGDARYDVRGQVVHVAADWWVLDVGLRAYLDQKPPRQARLGGWLHGQISLCIDPFCYFERRAREAGAPALIYDWEIEKIEIQTAPLVETRPRHLERDAARLGWKEIAETAALTDDGGLADYLLHCRRLDGPARRALKAS